MKTEYAKNPDRFWKPVRIGRKSINFVIESKMMGWNFSMALVNSTITEDKEVDFLKSLGYSCKKFGTASFYGAVGLSTKQDYIALGRWKDCLIIADNLLITGMAREKSSLSYTEAKLATTFPKAKILSIILSEISNSLVFSIIDQATRIRFKCMNNETETLVFGLPLDIERDNEMDELAFKLIEKWLRIRMDKNDEIDKVQFNVYKILNTHTDVDKYYTIELKKKQNEFSFARILKIGLAVLVLLILLLKIIFIAFLFITNEL